MTQVAARAAECAIKTSTGMTTMLSEASVAALRATLRGDLLQPGDDDYSESRKVWNLNIDKHPSLIARCIGAADVVACVNFGRDHDLLVSVRGGGHNISGTAVADGGMVIDLSRMNAVRVDPTRRVARAEGGTRWGEFDRETQAFGLATTGGTFSDTGIAGLTLGGGLGWLAGKHGLALDNLIAADVVTADGVLRTASPNEDADLFWAIRGGGGNFGVVTSFEYQVHPVGPLQTALAMYPLDQAREVFRFYDDFAHSVPDEMNTGAALVTLPDGPVAAVVAAFNGPLAEGERALAPLRDFGAPLMVQVQPMTYLQVQHWLDPFLPDGHQYFETAPFMRDIPQGAADAVVDAYARSSSPGNVVLFLQLGNAANRVPATATAFGHRDAHYALIIISRWSDPAESDRHYTWARDLRTATAPFATGGEYVNGVGTAADSGSDVVRSAYGSNHRRLAEVKRIYDPGNLFRHNQNIAPAV